MNLIPAVITVVVVLLLLVVFRATDKNNQSLDKVRRYADKVAKDLDKLVDEKTQNLKNTALEMDVHHKIEKQLLSRVSEIQESLTGKSDEIDSLFHRLAEYDRSMNDLQDMTRKVDENLQLLKTEESFLDSLSKRIHSSNDKMDKIDKGIARIFSDFAGKNQEQINNLWKSATKEAERVSEKLHQDLEHSKFRVDEFSDYMQQLEVTRDSLEDNLITSAKERMNTLLEKTLDEHDQYFEEAKARSEKLKVDSHENLILHQKEVDKVKEDYKASVEKVVAGLKNQLKSGEQMVSSIKISTDGLEEKADHVKSLIDQIHKYDKDIETLSTLSVEVKDNLTALKQGDRYVSSVAKRLKNSQDRVNKIESQIPEIENKIAKENEERLGKIAEEVKFNVEQTASAFMTDFEVIQESVNKFSSQMESLENKRDELFESAERDLEQRLKLILTDAGDESDRLSEQFKQDLSRFSSSIREDLQKRVSKLQDDHAEIERSLGKLHDQIGNDAVFAVKQIETSSNTAVMNLNQEIEKVTGASKQTLTQIRSRIELLQDDFEKNVMEYSNEISKKQSDGAILISKLKGVFEELEDKNEQVSQIFKRLDDYHNQIETLAQLSDESRESIKFLESRKVFVDKLGVKIKRSEKYLSDIETRLPALHESFSSENEERIQFALKQVLGSSEKLAISLKADMETISQKVSDFGTHIGMLENRRDELGDALLVEMKEKYKALGEGITDDLVNDYKEELEKLSLDYEKNKDSLSGEVKNVLDEMEKQITESEKDWQTKSKFFDQKTIQIESDFEKIIADVIARAKTLDDELFTELRNQLEAKVSDTARFEQAAAERLQKAENRLSEFEESLQYRFDVLDQIPENINDLEVSLRCYMEEGAATVKDDFIRFSEDLEEQRKIEKDQASALFADFRKSMTDIESNIDKIKTEAYQNVSEKLGLLEDDFFSDLKGRSDEMSNRLELWEGKVKQSLDQISKKSEQKHKSLETHYYDEVNKKMDQAKSYLEKGLETLNIKLINFQDELELKMSDAEKEVTGVSVQYKNNLVSIEKQAEEMFKDRLLVHNNDFEKRVIAYEKEFDDRIQEIEENVTVNQEELDKMLEDSKGEMSRWKQEVSTNIEEEKAGFDSVLEGIREESANAIEGIRTGFIHQKQSLEDGHKRYMDELQANVDGVRAQVEHLSDDFERRGTQLEKNLVEADSVLKLSIKETRGQLIEMQKNLERRITDSISLHKSETANIDKQIKAFIGQTKLFKRADELRAKLKQSIDGMKKEILLLNGQRKELKETDKHFDQIRKIESDLSAKLNNMISQKRKIEEMDHEFRHLLELSLDVENRLDKVTERSDQLQLIEAKVRHLDEMEKDVDQKYDRLDKKQEIIDTTIKSVDLNFKQLTQLEEKAENVESGFLEFLEQLKKSNEKITKLSNSKHDADMAVKRLAQFDKELAGLEKRMTKMQSAREWLAGVETRLQNLHDESDAQVKLLGSLLKSTGKKVDGVQMMDHRMMVVRLSRMNWTVAQIAETTGLSKGEVELILEIAPRKRK